MKLELKVETQGLIFITKGLVWASPPASLVHLCAAAQSAKELGEVNIDQRVC